MLGSRQHMRPDKDRFPGSAHSLLIYYPVKTVKKNVRPQFSSVFSFRVWAWKYITLCNYLVWQWWMNWMMQYSPHPPRKPEYKLLPLIESQRWTCLTSKPFGLSGFKVIFHWLTNFANHQISVHSAASTNTRPGQDESSQAGWKRLRLKQQTTGHSHVVIQS